MQRYLRQYPAVLGMTALVAIPAAWAALQAQNPPAAAATPAANVDFARDIQPILQSTCSNATAQEDQGAAAARFAPPA